VEPLTTCDDNIQVDTRQATLDTLLNNTPLSSELDSIFECISYKELEKAILAKRTRAFSPLGRFGYSISSLLKAYIAGYVIGVKNTNDLIRRLQEDPILSTVCGFDYKNPPCKRTFIRFLKKLLQHQDLIDNCLNEITDRLGSILPGFGKSVAIDATPVHSHSDPDNKRSLSDSKAGWVFREGNENKRWVFGYRLHLVVDTNYELPIQKETTINGDKECMVALPILRKAKEHYLWFNPEVVICDKGYDSSAVFEGIVTEFDADPIIKVKGSSTGKTKEITGSPSNPICPGGLPLIFKQWDKQKGLRYKCPEQEKRAFCPLPDRCQIKTAWIKPGHDFRRFGYRIKRGTKEFDNIYSRRTAVERVNSRLKDKRRLDAHCTRGFDKINLHCTLSVLAMNAMALAKAKAGQLYQIRCSSRLVN
jgi:transposase